MIEHPAIIQPCEFLRRLGCRITHLPVDGHGGVNPDDVRSALKKGADVVSIMHSNNEVGTLQLIGEIGKICRDHNVPLHTDAAQSLGKVEVNVDKLGVDLLSIAGHKLYAPKGVGALYVRGGLKLEPVMCGAGHENGRRAGTENVPYLVGLGRAAELARESLPGVTTKLQRLRETLWEGIQEHFGEQVVLNGHPEHRLPNTLNVNFVDHVGAELLERVPEIAASTGSACHEGQVTLSGVLCAMGVKPEIGKGAVRMSVGRWTTEEEVSQALTYLKQATRAPIHSQ